MSILDRLPDEFETLPYVLALVLLSGLGMAAHAGIDSGVYGNRYNNLRSSFTAQTTTVCGTGDNGRADRLAKAVNNNIESIRNGFKWLPSKQAFGALEAAQNDNLVLFPVSFHRAAFVWPEQTEGVVFKDGKTPPVFAYRTLDAKKLDSVTTQFSGQQGALILRSASGGGYSLTPATAQELKALGGNPCLIDGTEAGNGHLQIDKKIITPAVKAGEKALERLLRPK